MNAINATKETHQLADSLNNYAHFCNSIQTQVNAQDIKYYIRDVVDCAMLIAFFFTAADNTNAAAKNNFMDSYITPLEFYLDDYVDIKYADSSARVSLI